MRPTCEADIREALKAEGFNLKPGEALYILKAPRYCGLCDRVGGRGLRLSLDANDPGSAVKCDLEKVGDTSYLVVCPDRLSCAAAQRGADSERLRSLLGEVTIPQRASTGPNEEPHE